MYKLEKIPNIKRIVCPQKKIESTVKDTKYAETFVENLDREYANNDSTQLPLKYSVSVILKELSDEQDFKREDFVDTPMYNDAILESTDLGIAYHSAMQCYECGQSEDKFLQKVEQVLDEKQKNAVDFDKLIRCKKSLDNIIGDSKAKIYKEQKFMMTLPYNQVFVQSDNTDKIIIQGIVDIMIEYNDRILVIDYKTNKTTNPKKLFNEYRTQLNLYKLACELSFEKKVDSVLYAFSIGDFVGEYR